jgi:aconitate hydratase
VTGLDRLPLSIRILLESALRNLDEFEVRTQDVMALARWSPGAAAAREVPFKVARVILQDFTGVPAVVDLAAMRSAMKRAGGDPARINPLVPVDLVIDHSVQVDAFGNPQAPAINAQNEFARNRERYEFLKWGQQALANFRVVPPETGIVHQVNLEYLAKVVWTRDGEAYPDTLVGTDSHTTMINGLGVVGWGVGGIEAEACMLGQPIYMAMPQVVGFELTGQLPPGSTATDLVLVVTQMLRAHGVVDKFVEFFGEALDHMTVADRATLANMAPEYGATMGLFPIDAQTLDYLRLTGRDPAHLDLVERYCKEQGLWRQKSVAPVFDQTLRLDLASVKPSVAGPRRPQDRVELSQVSRSLHAAFANLPRREAATPDAESLTHGSVAIAAITSCTNTSNPSVMLAAGLLARKAVERGLRVPSFVKTSLAPGSRVVTDYLHRAGLDRFLDQLGFNTVGYGCTTCIGNSGPLPQPVARAVEEGELVVAAVLSGNRNFEGRINPLVKASYLASPPLVVAYALAGTVDIDLTSQPLGRDASGQDVFLRDLWPSEEQVNQVLASCLDAAMFRSQYANVESGNPRWNQIAVRGGQLYQWDASSTYVQEPPFFMDLSAQPAALTPIAGARVLAMLGDSVTTDHISPAGSIRKDSPAGRFLMEHGVAVADFNSYGARRGDWRVMMRGTFANVRLRNLLSPGTEGPWTNHQPDGRLMSIYDAAVQYRADGVPLVVLAGKDYGMGSSRDWAAKGTFLLGVRAVIAESFERIHRSNLVGMGVLPLVYRPGENRSTLGLMGAERFDILGIDDRLKPGQELRVVATGADGSRKEFAAICRIDTPVEIDYYRHGGILHRVLRGLLG